MPVAMPEEVMAMTFANGTSCLARDWSLMIDVSQGLNWEYF